MKNVTLVTSLITIAIALLLSFKGNENNSVVEFLEALDDNQLEKVNLAFDDMSRIFWHFLPGKKWKRKGIKLKELTEAQRELALKILSEYLSEDGYSKTQKIIELENVLAELEENPDYRDPEQYFIAIYGNPRKDSLWAWSFEGHHLSLNFTILNGKIAASPRFFGANPATIPKGKRKGERTLSAEEDLAYELLNNLTDEQKQKAIFQSISFADIVTSNATEVSPLNPVGIEVRDLNATQKTILKNLIFVYLNSLPEKIALERENKILQEEMDKIRFGWAGGVKKGEAHYYRIQGKSFLVEFDNTQSNANHIHTVWRDFNGDFGKNLIKEHYHNSKHHKHE